MASPVLLQDRWDAGMKRDMGRHQLPKNAVWNLVNYIPNLGGPARKRGGWSYYSADALASPATYVTGLKHAPFVAGTKLVVIDEDGDLHAGTGGSWTDHGASNAVRQNPIFHRDLVIVPASNGTSIPDKYDGSSVSDLVASAFPGKYAVVHKDRTVIANSVAFPNRIAFSPVGTPSAAWDALSTFDASQPVTGLGTLRQALLVFSDDRVERLRGSIPPTTNGEETDFLLEFFVDEGCPDARSIVNFGDDLIYANTSGVWQTDGAVADNLVTRGGIEQYWKTTMKDYASTYTLCAGLYRSHYIICIMDGSTFVDCLACDVNKYAWYRLGNMTFTALERSTVGTEILFMGLRDEARVATATSMWSPVAGVKNDADTTAVVATVETAFFRDEPGFKRWNELYVGYDIRDAASDNPTLRISYIDSPEETSYTDITGGSLRADLPETTEYSRLRIPIRRKAHGLGFKILQQNASTDTYLYDIGAEVSPLSGSKV